MSTLELRADNFEETIRDNPIVLVDFWAAWCGPCRSFAPVFEEASTKHPDIVFAKVDTEAQTELAQAFGIMSIPTLMAFRDQIILYAQPGALPGAALEDLIGQIEGLDMDEVRRQIEAEQATSAE
jgi:thioredoxin 1